MLLLSKLKGSEDWNKYLNKAGNEQSIQSIQREKIT